MRQTYCYPLVTIPNQEGGCPIYASLALTTASSEVAIHPRQSLSFSRYSPALHSPAGGRLSGKLSNLPTKADPEGPLFTGHWRMILCP